MDRMVQMYDVPKNDLLTGYILKSGYSDAYIYIQLRENKVFVAFLKYGKTTYWSFHTGVLDVIAVLLRIFTDKKPIYSNKPTAPSAAIKDDTGILNDPLNDVLAEMKGKDMEIKLYNRDFKLIIADLTNSEGDKFRGEGKTVFEACENLFFEITARKVNLKKNLPTLKK